MPKNALLTVCAASFFALLAAESLAAAGPVSVEISMVPSASLPFQPPVQRLFITNHSGQPVTLPSHFKVVVKMSTATIFVQPPHPVIETDAINTEQLRVGDVEQLCGSRFLAANESRVVSFYPAHFLDGGLLGDRRLSQPGEYSLTLKFFSQDSEDRSNSPSLRIDDFDSESVVFVVREAEGEDKAVLDEIRELVSRTPRVRLQERWRLARWIWEERRSSSYTPYIAAYVGSPKSQEQIEIYEEAFRLAQGTSVAPHLAEILAATRVSRGHHLLTYDRNFAAANAHYTRARTEIERLIEQEPLDLSRRARLSAVSEMIPTPEQVRRSFNDQQ